CLRLFSSRLAAMIRIDAIWLATEPMDMRAGTETALARVIAVFGAAKPHCAYLFANRRATRMKSSFIGQACAMVRKWRSKLSSFIP
ncbi:IS66 family insertion sequence element accessory protein TnpB, partial [Pseudomonas syringae]|uniref:IS66 family insertion sequence element accessory protein TnpB n=1 Tax=Pseudomonas syringae TaxID=317 RepID=UPI001F1ABC64